jgi:hypothetical protein
MGKLRRIFGELCVSLFFFFFSFFCEGRNFIYPWSKWHFANICEVCEPFFFGQKFYLPLVKWHFANICEVKLGIVASFGGENFGGKCLNNKRMDY